MAEKPRLPELPAGTRSRREVEVEESLLRAERAERKRQAAADMDAARAAADALEQEHEAKLARSSAKLIKDAEAEAQRLTDEAEARRQAKVDAKARAGE